MRKEGKVDQSTLCDKTYKSGEKEQGQSEKVRNVLGTTGNLISSVRCVGRHPVPNAERTPIGSSVRSHRTTFHHLGPVGLRSGLLA